MAKGDFTSRMVKRMKSLEAQGKIPPVQTPYSSAQREVGGITHTERANIQKAIKSAGSNLAPGTNPGEVLLGKAYAKEAVAGMRGKIPPQVTSPSDLNRGLEAERLLGPSSPRKIKYDKTGREVVSDTRPDLAVGMRHVSADILQGFHPGTPEGKLAAAELARRAEPVTKIDPKTAATLEGAQGRAETHTGGGDQPRDDHGRFASK